MFRMEVNVRQVSLHNIALLTCGVLFALTVKDNIADYVLNIEEDWY